MDGVIEDNYGFNLYYISGFKENTIRQLTIKQLPSIISTRILLREIPLSVYKCFGNLTQLDAETVALVIDKKALRLKQLVYQRMRIQATATIRLQMKMDCMYLAIHLGRLLLTILLLQ